MRSESTRITRLNSMRPGPRMSTSFPLQPNQTGLLRTAGPWWPQACLHASLCCLFLGMNVAVVAPFATRVMDAGEQRILMIFLLGAAVLAGAMPYFHQHLLPNLGLGPWLVIVAATCGIVGAAANPGEEMVNGLAFGGGLFARNLLCFTLLPGASSFTRAKATKVVIFWLLASCCAFLAGSLRVAAGSGFGIFSSDRLNGGETLDWVNPNVIGLYAAGAVLVAMLADFIPRVARVAVVLLALYLLLLSQSRTSIAALAGALVVFTILKMRARRLVVGLVLAALVISFGAVLLDLDSIASAIPSLGSIQSMLERYQRDDGFGGRLAIIQKAQERIAQAPLFGYGFMSPDSRFENGYLSLAVESGLLGLGAYLVLMILTFYRGIRLYRRPVRGEDSTFVLALLCFSTFIVIHGLGERTHGFQAASMLSNAWAVLAGFLFSDVCERQPAGFRRIMPYGRSWRLSRTRA